MTEKEENYQNYIKVLDKYKIDNTLKNGNIFHLYAKEEAFPDGYFDSRFFDLWVFNTDTMTKRLVENRDGLNIYTGADVDIIRIFVDGSTLVRFKKVQPIEIFQGVGIGKWK